MNDSSREYLALSKMKKIRVLQFVNTLEFGGATDYALTLCENINPELFESFVATGPGDGWNERAENCSSDLLILESMKPSHTQETSNTWVGDLKALIQLVQYLRKNQIDVIHTHGSKSRLLGGVAACIAGTKLRIQSAHGFAFNSRMRPWKFSLFRFLERLMGKLHHLLVLESKHDFELAAFEKLGENRETIYTGVDLQTIKAKRPSEDVRVELGISSTAVVTIMVGRLTHQKDPHTFIKTAQQVISSNDNAEFIIVGDGDLDESSRALANDNPKIHFLGRRTDVYDLLNAADIYMLCSRWEGIPLTILMAQYMGKPIVATNKLGLPEVVVPEVTGVLANEEDHEGFAEAVDKLISSKELRNRLGSQGRELVVQRHELSKMIDQFETMYLKKILSE